MSANDPRITEFFAGLDEMRRYLQRHVQTPQERSGRLRQMGAVLLAPSSRRQIKPQWLLKSLNAALGAHASVLGQLENEHFKSMFEAGEKAALPHTTSMAALARAALAAGQGVVSGPVTVLPLGASKPHSVVGLHLETPLSEETLVLLAAIVAQAAALWEQQRLMREAGVHEFEV